MLFRQTVAGFLVSITAWLYVPLARAHPPTIVTETGERAIGEEIQAFRKAMADAIRARDAAKLQDMYAKRFTSTDAAGVTHTREAHIAAALAGKPVMETADVRDLVVRAPNDWVVVVSGTSSLQASGGASAQTIKWMAVYTRSEKSWVLVAQQATRAQDSQR